MRALMNKLALCAGAAALAGSGLVVGSAGPAAAATGCYADSCTGRDPSQTVCQNDAVTVGTGETGVELRYSPSCRAAWARKKDNGSSDSTITVRNSNGQSYSVGVPAYSSRFTLMVNDAGITSRACEYFGSSYSCTIWY